MDKKIKTFTVGEKLNLYVGIDVTAKSLEEALQKASNFGVDDFVTIDGEYLDGQFKFNSIWEND